MSITQKFSLHRLRSVLHSNSPGDGIASLPECDCLCEHSQKLWHAAPGSVFAVTQTGKILWSAQDVLSTSGINNCQRSTLAEVLSERFSEDGCANLLSLIQKCNLSGEAKSVWMNEHNETKHTSSCHVHCSPLQNCGGQGCNAIIVVSMFGAADGNVHTSTEQENYNNRVLELQHSAKRLGRLLSLDRSGTSQKTRAEMLDIEYLIRQSVGSTASPVFGEIPAFSLEKGPDLPKITAIREDWKVLLGKVMASQGRVTDRQSNSSRESVSVSLMRKARIVRFEFVRNFATADVNFDQQAITACAYKVGKLQKLEFSDTDLRLEILVPINAGIVAPDLANNEERVKNIRIAANANHSLNPIPRTHKTG